MKRLLIFLTAACGFGAGVHAEEQPVVRVAVTPETVNVGESAQVRVTVLVPTWFTRPPVYPGFELANAITRLPPDSSFPTSERVGNETWSGIVRDYRVYPMLGASYRISGQVISVAYANPGSSPLTVDVDVPEIVFRGEVPAGAESLEPYLAGRQLSLSRDIEGNVSELKVGDALVIRYAAELDGLPAIFLPPLAPDLGFAGVSVYADVPKVEDGATARRSETLTLVFEAGGEFSIPDFELSFWNTASGAIETAFVAGLSIAVDGPAPIPPGEAVASERRWQPLAALLIGVLVIALVLRRWGPQVSRYFRDAATRRRQTERYAFTQLQKAVDSQGPEAAYHALLAWIEKLQPGMSARSFAHAYGDASLLAALDALSAGLYREPVAAERIDKESLGAGLAKARERFLRQRASSGRASLPPLNP